MLIWPDADAPERWADMGIIAGAGLVAGPIYWLIAGRDAASAGRSSKQFHKKVVKRSGRAVSP
ncbi:hypothetical protein ACVOMV_36745 [Mesorhizobium atlanticum]